MYRYSLRNIIVSLTKEFVFILESVIGVKFVTTQTVQNHNIVATPAYYTHAPNTFTPQLLPPPMNIQLTFKPGANPQVSLTDGYKPF
jgi:hypothetical protein